MVVVTAVVVVVVVVTVVTVLVVVLMCVRRERGIAYTRDDVCSCSCVVGAV